MGKFSHGRTVIAIKQSSVSGQWLLFGMGMIRFFSLFRTVNFAHAQFMADWIAIFFDRIICFFFLSRHCKIQLFSSNAVRFSIVTCIRYVELMLLDFFSFDLYYFLFIHFSHDLISIIKLRNLYLCPATAIYNNKSLSFYIQLDLFFIGAAIWNGCTKLMKHHFIGFGFIRSCLNEKRKNLRVETGRK